MINRRMFNWCFDADYQSNNKLLHCCKSAAWDDLPVTCYFSMRHRLSCVQRYYVVIGPLSSTRCVLLTQLPQRTLNANETWLAVVTSNKIHSNFHSNFPQLGRTQLRCRFRSSCIAKISTENAKWRNIAEVAITLSNRTGQLIHRRKDHIMTPH